MVRGDLSDQLIHLTKGTTRRPSQDREQAVKNLLSILDQGKLIGGTGMIKGKFTCVCFSEAPVSMISQILAASDPSGFKYQPYGVMVQKRWLYEKGARPAIYGPDSDFEKLPEDFRYRHVRFELGAAPIDLTWEREWRLRAAELHLPPKEVTIVVPDRHAKEVISAEHPQWHYLVLSDLGAYIEPLLDEPPAPSAA